MGKSGARITKPPVIPPLRDGDRMNAREFWKRYEASPNVTRAELIRGVVHIISEPRMNGKEPSVPPISTGGHSDPHADVIYWLRHYSIHTPGTRGSAPGSVRSPSDDSAPEPDSSLRILPGYDGQTTMDDQGFLHGAPELLFEVANTTASLDLGEKFEVYQADGVREYLVWRIRQRQIDWFRLNRTGRFVSVRPDDDSIFRSRVFPGLWLGANALISGDFSKVLAVLNKGLASPEHAAFVEKLRRAAARKKR
jgi:Uma2 family endonuclease